MWRSSAFHDVAPAVIGGNTTSPSRHRESRPRRPEHRGKARVNTVEDGEEEQAPPAGDEAPPAEDAPLPAEPELEVSLAAGDLAAMPSIPSAPVTMGLADNYDSMDDSEKRCFEAYIITRMDSSLVNYIHSLPTSISTHGVGKTFETVSLFVCLSVLSITLSSVQTWYKE